MVACKLQHTESRERSEQSGKVTVTGKQCLRYTLGLHWQDVSRFAVDEVVVVVVVVNKAVIVTVVVVCVVHVAIFFCLRQCRFGCGYRIRRRILRRQETKYAYKQKNAYLTQCPKCCHLLAHF